MSKILMLPATPSMVFTQDKSYEILFAAGTLSIIPLRKSSTIDKPQLLTRMNTSGILLHPIRVKGPN